jgi:hypothetical protein
LRDNIFTMYVRSFLGHLDIKELRTARIERIHELKVLLARLIFTYLPNMHLVLITASHLLRLQVKVFSGGFKDEYWSL